MDINNKNHCNNDSLIINESNEKKRIELAYFGRICMLLVVGCLTMFPCHSQARAKSSAIDNFIDMPTLKHERISRYFQELIKMKWSEIKSKLEKMSVADSIKLFRTLSAVNDHAASLLDTDIDERIKDSKPLECDQISLFIKLANKYNLSSIEKLRKILSEDHEISKENYQFLMSQYIELCRLIGSNAFKYSKVNSFLNKNGVISDYNGEIENFVSDWEEYVLSLENRDQ